MDRLLIRQHIAALLLIGASTAAIAADGQIDPRYLGPVPGPEAAPSAPPASSTPDEQAAAPLDAPATTPSNDAVKTYSNTNATLECLIRPSKTVRLGTSVGGVISRLNVDRGDWVEEGTIIAELETEAPRALAAVYNARAADRSGIDAAEQRVTYLRAEHKRLKALNDEALLSDAELQKAKTDWLVAAADLRKEKTALIVAAHERDKAVADLEQRIIRAPVSGVVTERNFVPGEYWPAQQSLATIAAIDTLHIEAFAGIDLYGTIKVGDTALIKPQAPVGGAYDARVDIVDPVLDAASHTFDIRLSMANPGRSIPAGIKCAVQFGQ